MPKSYNALANWRDEDLNAVILENCERVDALRKYVNELRNCINEMAVELMRRGKVAPFDL